MHRPGIASLEDDTVVLNGTTLDEVQKYHRDTLILAANEANKRFAEAYKAARIADEQEAGRLSDHRKDVEEKAKRIKFDED
jgi:hypothetical protein